MFTRFFIASLVSLVAVAATISQSKAAIETEEFTVNASNFVNANTADPVPYSTFTTTFDITFDPSTSYDPTKSGFLLKSASFGFDSSYYGFQYDPTGAQGGGPFLAVGGIEEYAPGLFVLIGSDNHFDLSLSLDNAPFDSVRYITVDDSNFFAGTISASVASVSTVPLPAALPLLGAAFAGLTGIGMRKSRANKAAA